MTDWLGRPPPRRHHATDTYPKRGGRHRPRLTGVAVTIQRDCQGLRQNRADMATMLAYVATDGDFLATGVLQQPA